MDIQLLRTDVQDCRPIPEDLLPGQPLVNTNSQTPGLYFSSDSESLIKVGPTSVGNSPPTEEPTPGEMWLQPDPSLPVLWVYDGTNWRGVELPLSYEVPSP